MLTGSTNSGYIGARFYGMRSQLLKRDDYERLQASSDFNSFITTLRGITTYKRDLEKSLLLEDPLTAVNTAINIVLSRRMQKILSFTGGDYNQAFQLMNLRWEVSNIHLAIRSIIERTEFPINFIPMGHLDIEELKYLTTVSGLSEALSYLESILSPMAPALRTIIEKNIPSTDLNAIDSVFNQFYQQLMNKGLEKLEDKAIREIMQNLLREEREFENTKYILNLIGKLTRGTISPSIDFNSIIFPGKARIKPDEIEQAAKNRDINSLMDVLQRTSFQSIFSKAIIEKGVLDQYVEEVERSFYTTQVRKRFKRHTFNLGLAYFWQMSIEARNLRILAHGLENFPREELSRRLFFYA